MKNTKIPIIKGHWCKLRVILLSLLYPCLGYSCSDSASSAIPDDWIYCCPLKLFEPKN